MADEPRIEPILILYGTQTGNSEQVAKDICEQITNKLNPDTFKSLITNANSTSINTNVIIKPIIMQLDDFIEIYNCQWTRIFIIAVSSYGTGQAPLGSVRFREFCDYLLLNTANKDNDKDNIDNNTNTEKYNNLLSGTYFAMCGLGDSKYTTYFKNPTVIHNALNNVGSIRIGELGKADASSKGMNNTQLDIIDLWMNNIWKDLANIIINKPQLSNDELIQIQNNTMNICYKINPDLQKQNIKKNNNNDDTLLLLIQNLPYIILIVLISILVYFVMQKS